MELFSDAHCIYKFLIKYMTILVQDFQMKRGMGIQAKSKYICINKIYKKWKYKRGSNKIW